MHYFYIFYKKTLKYDLLNKFSYSNTKKIPKLKKIILNFGCKTTEIKTLLASLLALELITEKSSKITKTKKANIKLKIQKGNPVGCKVTLYNTKMYEFITQSCLEIIPTLKNLIELKINKKSSFKSFSFTMQNLLQFPQLETHYSLFSNLKLLHITVVLNCKNKKELEFTLKSLNLPIS